MRLAGAALAAALLACSRSEPPPTPAPAPSTTSAATAPSPSPGPSSPPPTQRYTSLGVCNRLLSTGEISHCELTDGGDGSATFHVGPAGRGLLIVARDDGQYQRTMNNMNFGQFQLATSDDVRVIVAWKGGSELAAASIRATVAGLGL